MVADYLFHQADLNRLAARSRLRQLSGRAGADFTSNDYLGLASSHALTQAVQDALQRGVPVGSGGSRLLRGNHSEHVELEAEAAAFFGSESALFFSTGYAANSALFATLPQRGDLIVYDELIHASVHEGMRIGRAERLGARHNDAGSFAEKISIWRKQGGTGRVWIAAESLYSMDGDQAPLAELAELSQTHDAVLVIDEAHATGLFGQDGRGLAMPFKENTNMITLHTCGKAMGCEGALLCGPQVLTDYFVNRGRSTIFSTAPSPLMAAAVRAALTILRDEPERRSALWQKVRLAEQALGISTGSQILPVIIGQDDRTMAIAAALQQAGYDVRGIRPPTVPSGTSRLRIVITLNVSDEEISGLGDALASATV